MGTRAAQHDGSEQQSFGWVTGLGAILVTAGETVGAYLLLGSSLGFVSVATVAGTGLVAAVLVGALLLVVGRQAVTETPDAAGDKPTLTRAAELTVSITVLTLLTAVAFVCGLALAFVAGVDGPDPRTDDGDRLRDRLLAWSDRNREFMRTNGEGELPLEP
jgi:hypothetical protein